MRLQKPMNRYEKRELNRQKVENHLRGEGIFVYRNKMKVDMILPKPHLSGTTRVSAGQEFQGDSYFLSMLGPGGLSLVRTIVPAGTTNPVPPAINNEEVIMETQKLLLDQPDTVTTGGKVEHVVETLPSQKKVVEQKKSDDILLIENPLDGVEILDD